MIVAARLAAVGGLIALWFYTQRLIMSRSLPPGEIGDKSHLWLGSLNAYLNRSPGAARLLLVTSSLGVDLLGLTILYRGVFGPSFRPVVGLALLLSLRQLSQYFCALPSPAGMIWRHPGVPSIFVTYGVTNDLFFSGHTGLAVYGSLTLASLGIPWLTAAVVALGCYEVFAVLALRAHWTMDVYAGLVSALLCWVVSGIFTGI